MSTSSLPYDEDLDEVENPPTRPLCKPYNGRSLNVVEGPRNVW